jgi:hypothetical protein
MATLIFYLIVYQDGELKFNLYRLNLSKLDQELFFETIKTIKFPKNE